MTTDIALRPYGEEDYPLLEAVLGDPAMMTFMGGPDTQESLRQCHAQYVEENVTGDGNRVFVILAEGLPAGTVGFWQREHDGENVWETGVSVLVSFQGQGIGTRAMLAIVERMRMDGRYAFAYAYPMVENHVSNAMCRKVGFTLEGEDFFEYPPGNFMRCNMWRMALT